MRKIIAVFNQAGGVAKSTMTFNVGYSLTRLGFKVLLVDMDPQASLTDFLGFQVVDEHLGRLILDDVPLKKNHIPLKSSGFEGLDVIVSDPLLAKAEVKVYGLMAKEYRLRKILGLLADDYDYIIVDCPPSLGNLSTIALVAATDVLIPVETTYKALRATKVCIETIWEIQEELDTALKIIGFIPTKYDGRRNHDKESLKALRDQLTRIAPVYEPIPYLSVVADSVREHSPVEVFDPRSSVVPLIRAVAEDIATKADTSKKAAN